MSKKGPHLSPSMEKYILLTMQWIPCTHCSQKYISKGGKSDKHGPQGQEEEQQLNYPYPLSTGEPTRVQDRNTQSRGTICACLVYCLDLLFREGGCTERGSQTGCCKAREGEGRPMQIPNSEVFFQALPAGAASNKHSSTPHNK